MIATTIGVSIRIWLVNANPDSSVQTASGSFPDTGEFLMNTANGALYVCTQGGPSQTWQSTTNSAMVLSLISSNILQSDWNQTNISSQDYIKNKPSTLPSRSSAYPVRTLNTVFQINTARDAFVVYCVDLVTTLSLAGGQLGTVYLETASDSAFTANVRELGEFSNGNTGALTVGLNLTQTTTANLSGRVEAGYYVRLRTKNTTGTPTFTFRNAQENLL